MNNSKVRIYDLSKELNLDNRDILVICDQLNIAVKNHSSTISEVDAERTRRAAENYVAPIHPQASVIRSGATHLGNSLGVGTKSEDSPQPSTNKQQIVKVRRPQTVNKPEIIDSPIPPVSPTIAKASVSPSVSSSPPDLLSKPLITPEPISAKEPNPSIPVVTQAIDAILPTPAIFSTPIPTETSVENPLDVSLTPTTAVTPPIPPATEFSNPTDAFTDEPKAEKRSLLKNGTKATQSKDSAPTLSEPPSRPVPRSAVVHTDIHGQAPGKSNPANGKSSSPLSPPIKLPSASPSKPVTGTPPIPKRPVAKPIKPETLDGQKDKPPSGDAPGHREPKPKPVGGVSKQPSSPESSTLRKPPSVVEIRRPSRPGSGASPVNGDIVPPPFTAPQRPDSRPTRGDGGEKLKGPNRPNGLTSETKAETKTDATVLLGVEPINENSRLRRPEPPRTSKRGKGWEEEEEELQAKSVKAVSKGKRRQHDLVEEEDDDFQSILSRQEGGVQVTLSLVRPAKPKTRTTQVKSPSAPTARVKKPAPGQPGTGSNEAAKGKGRRDRTEEAVKERPSQISIRDSLTVQQLSSLLEVADTEIVKILFYKGILATVTQTLDVPTIKMVAEELEVAVVTSEQKAEARKVTEMLDATDLECLQHRPPVVTIMGHVDHGKTTLLDSIRKTKVAQGEAGGITQHIGAYHVDVDHDGNTQQVVFLDTPGHEAFTAMRARGARVTDIAILVVAADDGVQPQTVEAISHAQAAEVPIIVAINKIDKEDAQPDRVKQELTEYGLLAEEWGGQTIMVPVSAIKGENLDTLLEMILLVAEIEELSANPDRPAKGTVIEAHLDKSRGPVATLLIQNGTLRVGDVLVAGSVLGKVRAMIDDRGDRVDVASPSFAVEVLGLTDVPAAGDEFDVYIDEKQARAIADERMIQQRDNRLQVAMASRRVTLNSLSVQAQQGELKELNLILKADVQGSLEAILASLKQLPQQEVHIRVLLAAPGEVTETDVDLAAASNAVIIGFNTTFASGARQAADGVGVDVRDYDIIYKLLEDVQGAMEGLLEPELIEESLGQVEVRAVFPVGRGSVAGCYVQSGKVIRNCHVRVKRENKVIHQGLLDSLRRMKEDAKEVSFGYECGIGCDSFNNWVIGDIIEAYRMVTKRRTLSTR